MLPKSPGKKHDQGNSGGEIFKMFREKSVAFINKYADMIFPVSNRTREICEAFGIKKEKLHTLYRGTSFASTQKIESSASVNNDFLRVAYIGYCRREKGFYFLLDSLEGLSRALSGQMELVFACKIRDPLILKRLKGLSKIFKNVTVINGYTHDNL
jgi:hypothetical protein